MVAGKKRTEAHLPPPALSLYIYLTVQDEELRTMSNEKVTVEIFTAGDGINYPKKGQTVTIHYTGYACNRLAAIMSPVFLPQPTQALLTLLFYVFFYFFMCAFSSCSAGRSSIPRGTEGSLLNSSSQQSRLFQARPPPAVSS